MTGLETLGACLASAVVGAIWPTLALIWERGKRREVEEYLNYELRSASRRLPSDPEVIAAQRSINSTLSRYVDSLTPTWERRQR